MFYLGHIMKIDAALILAAGKGQRMGEIGQKLPKILWPIFEKSLIELQLEKMIELGAKSVYFNVYNYKEIYQEFYLKHNLQNRMNILEENDVLDIGGAIHNFKNKVGDKILLLANGDQFLTINDIHINKGLKLLVNNDIVLFTYPVKKIDGYNKLNIEEGQLKGITKNKEIKEDHFETYTGYAIINLKNIKYQEGQTSFFESVANWNDYNVGTCSLGETEYWDFGTLDRYYLNITKILNIIDDSKNSFIQFLKRHKAIKENKIIGGQYVETELHLINNGSNKLITIFPDFEISNAKDKTVWHKGISNHPHEVFPRE